MNNLTLGFLAIYLSTAAYAGYDDVDKAVYNAATATGLTDEQKRTSKTYIDQSKANTVVKDACGQYGCNPEAVDQKAVVFDRTFDAIVPVAEQMYTAYFGAKGKIKISAFKPEDQKALNAAATPMANGKKVTSQDRENYAQIATDKLTAQECQKKLPAEGLSLNTQFCGNDPSSKITNCGYELTAGGVLKKNIDEKKANMMDSCCSTTNDVYLKTVRCGHLNDNNTSYPREGVSPLSQFNSAFFEKIVKQIDDTITGSSGLQAARLEKATENAQSGVNVLEQDDFCAAIPISVETLGNAAEQVKQIMAQTTASTAQESKSPDYAQRASLLAMKKAHEGKKESANIKQAGWSLASACYGTFMSADVQNGGPGFVGITDAGLPARVAATSFLGYFYGEKSKRHQQEMDVLDQYIAKLPSPGDCNPFTQRSCYCDEAGNKYDPNYAEYCVFSDYKDRFNATTNLYPTACVDENGKLDGGCLCQKNYTCIAQTVSSTANKLKLGVSFANITQGMDTIFSGKYNAANLKSLAAGSNAYAQRVLSQNQNYIKVASPTLSADQQAVANKLLEAGIPAKLAGGMAGQTSPSDGQSSALAAANKALLGSGSAALSASGANGSSAIKVVTYGDAKEKSYASKPSSSNAFNPFASLVKKPDSKAGSSIQIVDFSNRAIERASQIQQNSGVPLWTIISHRYRMSAWGRFEVDKELNAEVIPTASVNK